MTTTFQRILCPVDFSAPSRTALEHAESLAKTLGAQLVLAHVVAPAVYPVAFGALPMGAAQVEEKALRAAEDGLAGTVAELAEKGLDVSSLVEAGTPARRIVEWVREHGIDLVVMGTHGLTGIGHVLLGSTAERVVRTCPCPVLTVKAGEVQE